MPSFLRFQNVSFTYPTMTKPLLVGLNAHFPCGWTGVVGANGVGKSTLLKLAVGELPVQTGTVHHLGSALYCAQRTDEPPAAFAEFLDAAAAEAFTIRRQLGIQDDWPAGRRSATANASAPRSGSRSGATRTCSRSTNPRTTSTPRRGRC